MPSSTQAEVSIPLKYFCNYSEGFVRSKPRDFLQLTSHAPDAGVAKAALGTAGKSRPKVTMYSVQSFGFMGLARVKNRAEVYMTAG